MLHRTGAPSCLTVTRSVHLSGSAVANGNHSNGSPESLGNPDDLIFVLSSDQESPPLTPVGEEPRSRRSSSVKTMVATPDDGTYLPAIPVPLHHRLPNCRHCWLLLRYCTLLPGCCWLMLPGGASLPTGAAETPLACPGIGLMHKLVLACRLRRTLHCSSGRLSPHTCRLP